jgi:ribosomal-protein-alanine N-acetyltransferase
MPTYEIRNMTENDIPQIADIERMVFPSPWSEAALRSELHDNEMAMYLVLAEEEQPDEVLAYGGLWKIFDEGHITNIAVTPKAQGKQLGKMLLYAMIRWAWANGLSHMTLEVRINNHVAINLYKKSGFIDAGRRPGYYDDGATDAMVMWLHRKSSEAADGG